MNALLKMNKNLNELTTKDLMPVDFFHIRGPKSTKELAEECDLSPGIKILDIGCGIGGTARLLNSISGCSVTGVDLIDEYIRTASNLSRLIKLNEKTVFLTGSACELPFKNEVYDVVWTEHVQMNVKDKNKFYAEAYRVLKKGGRFVFHDVFIGKNKPVFYPVPWADNESVSFLMKLSEVEQLLSLLGYTISYLTDKTEMSAEAFQKSSAKIKKDGLSPLGLHLLMGNNTIDKINNMTRNLSEKRLRAFQCVCIK